MEERAERAADQRLLDLGQLARRGGADGRATEQALDEPQGHRQLESRDDLGAQVGVDDAVQRRLRHLGEGSRPGLLGDVDDLELDGRAELGRELRAGRAAERLVPAFDPALLLGGELGRTREVDLADALGAPRRRVRGARHLTALGRLDERGDLVVGEDFAHPRTPARSSTWVPPATLLNTAPVLTCTRTVRPLEPPVSAARTGMRASCSASRTARSLRPPMSRPLPPLSANIWAPPTRTASSCAGAAPRVRSRSTSAGTAWSANRAGAAGLPPVADGNITCASPASERRRSTRTSPMHEPSPIVTSTSPAAFDTASSPIRTMISAPRGIS